ncbi:hypothetical protein [Paenibacillus eucommiae]|uniref:NHLP leader peptide family natural product n=1 Tax=Paenibacillus eucommiae TaxID=1355755 RepID=A0ABS4IQZ0_9BACL|nr:hypothetical protein [Paenibacillus eucommiae]MBP1989988.1 hypothetical protein [Paenibacillus eucommiae]
MSWTEEQVKETATLVIEKASSDDAFRSLCLTDIYAAVKEATGKEVPQDFKINVVDGKGYHANIVLPEAKASADELSETELESVAGGSKSGANDFFGTVGNIAEDAARRTVNVAERAANRAIDQI